MNSASSAHEAIKATEADKERGTSMRSASRDREGRSWDRPDRTRWALPLFCAAPAGVLDSVYFENMTLVDILILLHVQS